MVHDDELAEYWDGIADLKKTTKEKDVHCG
jgi:hypothetical protein